MASAVPSYEELLDEAKKQPISISWNSNTYKEVKENERYYVTNEIGLCGWNDLGIALIDFSNPRKGVAYLS